MTELGEAARQYLPHASSSNDSDSHLALGCEFWLAWIATWYQNDGCEMLNTLEGEQHIEIARAFLAKGDQRLVFRRGVPRVERTHVGKFDDHNALWFPVAALGQYMAATFRQVTAAVFGHHRGSLGSVLVEFRLVGDDVFCNQVGWHEEHPPSLAVAAIVQP
jgi:hypothetical protein